MSMTKANVITFADILGHDLSNANTFSGFHDEIMDNLARSERAPFVASATFNVTSGTVAYTFPAAIVKLLGLCSSGTQLNEATLAELEHFNRTWRDDSGLPIAFTVTEQTPRSIRLYPNPSDSAANSGRWIYSQSPSTGIPNWVALYLTFAILEREFAYPSDHQDKTFSKLCGDIAQIFGMLIGVV